MTGANRIKQIGTADYSSEKAGVGGSIPSLATCFQVLTAILNPSLFHFVPIPKLGLVRVCLSTVWSRSVPPPFVKRDVSLALHPDHRA